jgi:hypothetical protein
MAVDLLSDPTAVRMTPEEHRKREIERLRPIPKKSSTSYATTGDGGLTPTRAADDEKRGAEQARLNPPPLVETLENLPPDHWKVRMAQIEKRVPSSA